MAYLLSNKRTNNYCSSSRTATIKIIVEGWVVYLLQNSVDLHRR